MAFRNKDGMAINFDSEELIAELKSDIVAGYKLDSRGNRKD